MICKWCGMESTRDDICSWCHRSFTVATPVQDEKPPDAESPSDPETAQTAESVPEIAVPRPGSPVFLGDPHEETFDTTPPAPTPPPASASPHTPPTATPFTPLPLASGRSGALSTPPRQADENPPPMQAIPIKRPGASGPARPADKVADLAGAPPPPPPSPPSNPIPTRPTHAPLVDNEPETIIPIASPAGRRADPGAAAPLVPPEAPNTAPAESPAPVVRTWYCRWCGLESETADTCSWCHKDIRSAATPPPPTGPTAPAPPASGTASAAPQFGTFRPQRSRYYQDKVVDPVSGAHYDPETGRVSERTLTPVEDVTVNEGVQLAKRVGIYFVILAVLVGTVAMVGRSTSSASAYLLALGLSNFAAGMAMPLLRVVPFGEDDSSDLGIALGLFLIFGPFVGVIIYGVICVLKSDFNPAIAGIGISYLALRVVLDAVTGRPLSHLMPFADPSIAGFAAQWMTLVGVIGWYAAGMFHKLDE